ncbi:hypothetical protein K469DRAFT_5510 [Zopfia rhizophila CBS 207.26]|uniref:Uncharacterized protein n=1 Tax=Zopfia rhizophila CBS 207.26 TaxID=1314779 RepID=A0A6A6EW40_9PEZI|nr:hypothetical protein K469DRAFT_5510 [Zopfia rhizophila CBS 207.26]
MRIMVDFLHITTQHTHNAITQRVVLFDRQFATPSMEVSYSPVKTIKRRTRPCRTRVSEILLIPHALPSCFFCSISAGNNGLGFSRVLSRGAVGGGMAGSWV